MICHDLSVLKQSDLEDWYRQVNLNSYLKRLIMGGGLNHITVPRIRTLAASFRTWPVEPSSSTWGPKTPIERDHFKENGLDYQAVRTQFFWQQLNLVKIAHKKKRFLALIIWNCDKIRVNCRLLKEINWLM